MAAFFSWFFLLLAPVLFILILIRTYKKIEGNKVAKVIIGIVLGGFAGGVSLYISAFIGLNMF